MPVTTREKLLEKGMTLLLHHGYHDTGIQQILTETGIPKGSFYHHFESKEAFGLAVIDYYSARVFTKLDHCLAKKEKPPIECLHGFFQQCLDDYDQVRYRGGCLFGNLGQELADESAAFRERVEAHFEHFTQRIASVLEAALDRGELSPWLDPLEMAGVLVNSWQGALIRMKLQQNREPVDAFCRFYFDALRAA